MNTYGTDFHAAKLQLISRIAAGILKKIYIITAARMKIVFIFAWLNKKQNQLCKQITQRIIKMTRQ